MFVDNTIEKLELLASPDHFWDRTDDEPVSRENTLEEAIWSTGILHTPKKTNSDWASSLETLTYRN